MGRTSITDVEMRVVIPVQLQMRTGLIFAKITYPLDLAVDRRWCLVITRIRFIPRGEAEALLN